MPATHADFRKGALLTGLALLVLALASVAPAAAASECGITVNVQPSVVNYPSPSLPAGNQAAFGETIDVNYSLAFVNKTITVLYYSGGNWQPSENIVGNTVGYTRTYLPLHVGQAVFGSNSVRVVSGACDSSASFTIVSDPAANYWVVAAYAVVWAAISLFLFAGLRLGKKWFPVVAAAAYLAIAPFTGQRYDVYFLISSGVRMLQHVNPFNPGVPPAYPGTYKWAFPPLYVPYGALSFLTYQGITHSSLPAVGALTPPSWYTSMFDVWEAFVPSSLPILVLLLKLPMVVSVLVAGLLLSRMTAAGSTSPLWLANPLVILVGAVWGTLDPITAALAIGAVYMFQKNRYYPAYLLASMGAAVKIWPVLLIPLFLAITLRREGLSALKPLAAILPAALLCLGIYSVSGGLGSDIYTLLYARAIPTFGNSFTVSGLTWQQFLSFWNAPALPIFLVVGIPAYLAVIVWVYCRREVDIVKWTIVSELIFFLTYNYVNPQYFLWVLPFLILQGRKVTTAMFTALPLLSVFFAYNIYYFVSPAVLPDYSSLGSSIADQLKVAFFNQTPWLSLLVLGVLPTFAYALTLLSELKPGVSITLPSLRRSLSEDEKGLVPQAVEGRHS